MSLTLCSGCWTPALHPLVWVLLEKRGTPALSVPSTRWIMWSPLNFICYNKSTSTMTECGCEIKQTRRVKAVGVQYQEGVPSISLCQCVCVCVCVSLCACGVHASCTCWKVSCEEWENVSRAGRCMRENIFLSDTPTALTAPWLMEFTSMCPDEL